MAAAVAPTADAATIASGASIGAEAAVPAAAEAATPAAAAGATDSAVTSAAVSAAQPAAADAVVSSTVPELAGMSSELGMTEGISTLTPGMATQTAGTIAPGTAGGLAPGGGLMSSLIDALNTANKIARPLNTAYSSAKQINGLANPPRVAPPPIMASPMRPMRPMAPPPGPANVGAPMSVPFAPIVRRF